MRQTGPLLQEAVERLYEAFQPWQPLPDRVTGCTLCFTAEDEAALRVEPRHVPLSALAQFIGHPPDHYNDYSLLLRRYFPPVAASLANDSLNVDAGLALLRLREAGWETWPEQERDSVLAFLRALLADVLQQQPAQDSLTAEEVLQGVCAATGSTREWLHLWDSVDSACRAEHVQLLVRFHKKELLDDEDAPLVGWWPEGARTELCAWLTHSAREVLGEAQAAGPRASTSEALAVIEALVSRGAGLVDDQGHSG